MTLIFCAQFNVTCILKLGVTFSFFEISLLTTFILITLDAFYNHRTLLWHVSYIDRVFVLFLALSFISIGIAFLRRILGNLPLSVEYPTPPILRSIMSLNKPLYYLLLIPVGNFLIKNNSLGYNNEKFLKYLAYSGIIPSIMVVIQWLALGAFIIHNNPSYSENDLRVAYYYGERAVGLSNEAAGHCFELFFCFIGLVHCQVRKILPKNTVIILYILFFSSVIMTISRTGMVFFIGYSVYAYFKYSRKSKLKKIIISLTAISVLVTILSSLKFNGFNLYERLLSTADVNSDLSTLERYGLADAMLGLFIDKGVVFGVGIYNYFYYIKDYIPNYMSVIVYDYGFPLPSFNFVVQLMAEYGLPLFLLFSLLVIRYIRKTNDSFISEWFIALFFFALSFQILNFSLPFIIMLYQTNKYNIKNYDSQNHTLLLA